MHADWYLQTVWMGIHSPIAALRTCAFLVEGGDPAQVLRPPPPSVHGCILGEHVWSKGIKSLTCKPFFPGLSYF